MTFDRHPRIQAASLDMHRQIPERRPIGWAIQAQGARTLFLHVDGNGHHEWTPDPSRAKLFTTQAVASRHVAMHMAGGSAKPVELYR